MPHQNPIQKSSSHATSFQFERIPVREFGRKDARISALGFGCHHLGDAAHEATAIRLVRDAVDGGISFFDNCW
jgi:predicted aldo/keto reductase-like oxidoreductase